MNRNADSGAFTGVVFDFNGTMFRDNEFHIAAWIGFARRYGSRMTREDYLQNLIGRTSAAAVERLLGTRIDPAELPALYEEKEAIYRSLILAADPPCTLAPGLAALLDRLAGRGIPVGIATASARANTEFFFAHFGLGRWFDSARIVFDNGTIANKPEPDIYLLAASRLGIDPHRLVIVEDSPTGAEAAVRAGAGCLVLTGEDSRLLQALAASFPDALQIPDFNRFDIERFFGAPVPDAAAGLPDGSAPAQPEAGEGREGRDGEALKKV